MLITTPTHPPSALHVSAIQNHFDYIKACGFLWIFFLFLFLLLLFYVNILING